MTPEAADWVYDVVLTATYRDGNTADGSATLTRTCRCQGGQCGHCQAGRHEQCTTRRRSPIAGPESYVVGRSGGALTPVWRSGRACRWRCSCVCPAPEPAPVEQLALVDAGVRVKRFTEPGRRRHDGELFGQLGLFDQVGGGS